MMREDALKKESILNKKGVTLIELLVVLVISAIVIGSIYKVFIAQTKAYTVQDQVAEVQQDVRGAMEIMVRDIRMAGYQADPPIVNPLGNNTITVNYAGTTVTYALVGGSLIRTVGGVPETLLDNVTNLDFRYGIDGDGDGIIDGINPVTGIISDDPTDPDYAFKTAAFVNGLPTAKVLAVLITLTGKAAIPDPDISKVVSPRTLKSVVTPRNMFFKRYLAY
jgi:prepilin-type N-terminal cleavage/methylation domain-containing protein